MKKALLVACAGAILAMTASAATIGPSCGSCFGGTYSLDGFMVSSAAGLETWQYTYTLFTQNVNISGVSYVGSIAAKVTTGLVSAATLSGPNVGGVWTSPALNTNVNNAGCDGNGNGWVCIRWLGGAQMLTGASAPAGGYSWVFDVVMGAGTSIDAASIKTNFDPANGKILSETINVAEGGAPIELPLITVGLGAWMFWKDRSNRRAAARA